MQIYYRFALLENFYMKTTNGKRGGNLVGKPHNDKSGTPVGGIKAQVTDAGGKPVELEGGEVIINKEASKKYWKELSKINQSAGNGVPIEEPIDPHDEDPSEYEEGGKIIEFNRNHLPNKWILAYAKSIKKDHPEIWKLGGNIYGNTAFENLSRVAERGYWLDSEEWMYKKWQSFLARHQHDFRIAGVVAVLKWGGKVNKGWAYMKNLIEAKISKSKEKPKSMKDGGSVEFKPEKKGTLIRGNEIIKYAEKVNGNYRLMFYSIKESKGKVPILCDAFDYCKKIDTNNVSPNELIDLIEKNNLMEQGGKLIKRADGSYSKRGLWDNIRDNAGSGKKPTKQMLEQEAKIKAESMRDGGSLDWENIKLKEDFDWNSLFEQSNTNYEPEMSVEQEREENYQNSDYSKRWAATYKEAVEKTLKEYLDAKASFEDWSSRKYKSNKGVVYIGGDDIFGEAKTIGSINDSRRNNTIKGLKMVMDESIETLKNLGLSDEEITDLTETKSFEDGGEVDDDKFNPVIIYHEKNGNWFIPKNTIYAWLYDVEDANEKLNSQEFDMIFFGVATMSMAFQKGFVPPLLRIWTPKYQKETKGSKHLMGIVKGWYDEDKKKFYVEMMTTNPKQRRKGINGHIIKTIREGLELTKDDVIFDEPTKMGKSFMKSGKFEDGGEVSSSEYLNVLQKVGITEEERENWRESHSVNQRQVRNDKVKEAAEKLKNGTIAQNEYLKIVAKEQPIKLFKEVPKLPTAKEIVSALNKLAVSKGIIGYTKHIEDGTKVASRLDIPAYENYDTWVVSVHDGIKEGQIIAYGQTAYLKDVEFKTFPNRALDIATGKEKTTIGRMFGNWENKSPNEVRKMAIKYMNDPNWVQVGMNPFRHSWFYDKKDGMPLVSSSEVIQVGALVLAKNPVKTTPDNDMFIADKKNPSIKFKDGGEIRKGRDGQTIFDDVWLLTRNEYANENIIVHSGDSLKRNRHPLENYFQKSITDVQHKNRVQKAIDEGKYEKAIKSGILTKERANEIIKSADLGVKFKDGGEVKDEFANTMKLIDEIKKHSFFTKGTISTAKDGSKYRYDSYKLKYPNSANWLVQLFEKASEENTGKSYHTQFNHTDKYSFSYDRARFKGMPHGRMGFKELVLM